MKIHSTLRFFTIFFLCVFVASNSYAESGAKQVLEAAVNDVLKELQSPELHSPTGRDAVIKRVEGMIYRLFDFEELSARTTGASWRSFNADQKKRFINAFTTLLRESYLTKLEDYDGEQVEYKNEVASSDGKRVEIQTIVTIKNKPVPVAYRMIKKNQWVIYDVNIEGVGMVQNYRKQFQEIIVKSGIESLISSVEQKAEEAKIHNKKEQLSS